MWQSKKIQLPSGNKALKVAPQQLNEQLIGAERSGYLRSEINVMVDWLNSLHGQPDNQTFATWQDLVATAADKSDAQASRAARERVHLDKRTARWPERQEASRPA